MPMVQVYQVFFTPLLHITYRNVFSNTICTWVPIFRDFPPAAFCFVSGFFFRDFSTLLFSFLTSIERSVLLVQVLSESDFAQRDCMVSLNRGFSRFMRFFQNSFRGNMIEALAPMNMHLHVLSHGYVFLQLSFNTQVIHVYTI